MPVYFTTNSFSKLKSKIPKFATKPNFFYTQRLKSRLFKDCMYINDIYQYQKVVGTKIVYYYEPTQDKDEIGAIIYERKILELNGVIRHEGIRKIQKAMYLYLQNYLKEKHETSLYQLPFLYAHSTKFIDKIFSNVFDNEMVFYIQLINWIHNGEKGSPSDFDGSLRRSLLVILDDKLVEILHYSIRDTFIYHNHSRAKTLNLLTVPYDSQIDNINIYNVYSKPDVKSSVINKLIPLESKVCIIQDINEQYGGWCFVRYHVKTASNQNTTRKYGYCRSEIFLKRNPMPDPKAKLHKIMDKETAFDIITRTYYTDKVDNIPVNSIGLQRRTNQSGFFDDSDEVLQYRFYLMLLIYANNGLGVDISNAEFSELTSDPEFAEIIAKNRIIDPSIYIKNSAARSVLITKDYYNKLNTISSQQSIESGDQYYKGYRGFNAKLNETFPELFFTDNDDPNGTKSDSLNVIVKAGYYIWIPSRDFADSLYADLYLTKNNSISFLQKEVVDFIKDRIPRGVGFDIDASVGAAFGISISVGGSFSIQRKFTSDQNEVILVLKSSGALEIGAEVGFGYGFNLGLGSKSKSSKTEESLGLSAEISAGVKAKAEISNEYEFNLSKSSESFSALIYCLSDILLPGPIVDFTFSFLYFMNGCKTLNFDPDQYLVKNNATFDQQIYANAGAYAGFKPANNSKSENTVDKNNSVFSKKNITEKSLRELSDYFIIQGNIKTQQSFSNEIDYPDFMRFEKSTGIRAFDKVRTIHEFKLNTQYNNSVDIFLTPSVNVNFNFWASVRYFSEFKAKIDTAEFHVIDTMEKYDSLTPNQPEYKPKYYRSFIISNGDFGEYDGNITSVEFIQKNKFEFDNDLTLLENLKNTFETLVFKKRISLELAIGKSKHDLELNKLKKKLKKLAHKKSRNTLVGLDIGSYLDVEFQIDVEAFVILFTELYNVIESSIRKNKPDLLKPDTYTLIIQKLQTIVLFFLGERSDNSDIVKVIKKIVDTTTLNAIDFHCEAAVGFNTEIYAKEVLKEGVEFGINLGMALDIPIYKDGAFISAENLGIEKEVQEIKSIFDKIKYSNLF